ncbi:hypothetical protein JVT61DRAFT_2938 [Boletus reticuloceps]|uniref:Uncharacterized protein n=1 Tax=Boletus reticuloceps TaxID=495285 RepID=A0A8I2YR71_9AGAM|nr:hypothetical protein JVT61DRAFT_2938 [Boletus reticuloceps]
MSVPSPSRQSCVTSGCHKSSVQMPPTVWTAAGNYTVVWDTSSKPAQVTNSKGMVYLRINGATQSTPLAQGFPLDAGHVNVTVPADTQPSDQWILVLFGDSGNWSPTFTIKSSSS